MSFRANELPTRPKPDIAFGLAVQARSPEKLGQARLDALEASPSANLHPRPSPLSEPLFAFPCIIHEVKSESGTQQYVENQLAKSLVFALEEQEELRLASNISVEERMPIFGLTSIGPEVRLFVAEMLVDETIVSVRCVSHVDRPENLTIRLNKNICFTGEFFEVDVYAGCACFIILLQALQRWSQHTYRPTIENWLDLVGY
jgi:hypothetical protein